MRNYKICKKNNYPLIIYELRRHINENLGKIYRIYNSGKKVQNKNQNYKESRKIFEKKRKRA